MNVVKVAWLATAVLLPALSRGNDAAAEVAAGGVQLRPERRVTMARERLVIAEQRVRVEYEFLNDSSEAVSTEVAFPVPPLKYRGPGTSPTSSFGDFRVWVDGAALAPKKDVRALLDGRDVTQVLTALGVGIEDFGRFDYEDDAAEFKVRLGPERLAALLREKLVDGGAVPWPRWQVAVTYHWNQTFPAGKVVRVRHEYTPAYGYEQVRAAEVAEAHKDGCFDDRVVQGLLRRVAEHQKGNRYAGDYVGLAWVKYILTTANTWRTPIRDFELVVERGEGRQVSFCWDGKVERAGKTSFRASAKDFVPTRELAVYFY